MEKCIKEQIDIRKFDDVLGEFEAMPFFTSPTGAQLAKQQKAREKVCYRVADLFPSFSNKPLNDHILSDFFLDQYGYYRMLGLSIQDTAYALELSVSRLNELLSGKDLSLEKFVQLIKAELFSRAQFKARLLRDIEQSSGTQNWKTSLALLEKLYPEEFGTQADKAKVVAEEEPAWVINIVDPKVPSVEETKENVND